MSKLISLKTAKAARASNFDLYVNARYEISRSCTQGRLAYEDIEKNWNGEFADDEQWYSAPSQDTLKRWLREKHHLEVNAYCNASGWLWEINKAYPSNGGTSIAWSEESGPNAGGEWETYEEALEDGLLKALKLI